MDANHPNLKSHDWFSFIDSDDCAESVCSFVGRFAIGILVAVLLFCSNFIVAGIVVAVITLCLGVVFTSFESFSR